MLRRIVPPGLALVLGCAALAVAATPKAPPPPADYDALVRFNIEGFRNQRASQFHAMKRDLVDLGFKEDADDPLTYDDYRVTTFHGQVASARARRLLDQRYVQTLRLAPAGWKFDKDKPLPVRVELELNAGLSQERQRQLRAQVLQVVAPLGFTEAFGYDHRGYARIVGTLADGKVDAVAGDLRRHPAGWALLPRSLLTDIRSSHNGLALLRQILDDWYDHPEGKKILSRTLTIWRAGPQAVQFLRTLPDEVVSSDSKVNRVRVEVHLLAHMSGDPDSGDRLRQLLGDVMDSKANRELMDILLKRVNAHLTGLGLPLFYATMAPIRVVEVFPGLPAPSSRPAPPAIPAGQEKITPDLRQVLADMAEAAKPRRLELIFALPPDNDDRVWRRMLLETVPGSAIEGRLGKLVTVLAPTRSALSFASIPEIAVVRLPRVARPRLQEDPTRARENFEPLRKGDTQPQRAIPVSARNQPAAVIDSDFRGWEKLRGKELPANTRLVDLTSERNLALLPDPQPGPADQLGHGTRYAMALVRAVAPKDLTLIRIDPAAPYQVAAAARVINGDGLRSFNLDQRLIDLDDEHFQLRARKLALLDERREVLDNFGIDDESLRRRKDYFKRQEDFDDDQKDHQVRIQRFFQIQKDIRALKGIRVVASALVWNEGYPIEGGSTLSRYFDERPFKGALWFQAAGDTRGQAWQGFFRDADANGVMEFAPMTSRLPEEAWSREMNWLGWRTPAGEAARDLPANTLLRLTLQWREAHDPSFLRSGDDAFRLPLADFRIVLCQQLDPTGAKRPTDDLELTAQSVGSPQRLDSTAEMGIYEQVLQVRVPRAGRYLVRIEGKAPDGTRPADAPTIPGAKRVGEVYPRLYVETLDGVGRAVWHTYTTEAGTLGMPADAMRVTTVGGK